MIQPISNFLPNLNAKKDKKDKKIDLPISADLLYKFYDNKAITPQIRDALQKRQDEEAKASEGEANNPNRPGPATRVNISEQIIRMNIANGTVKPEDLKNKVEPSKEVQEIEKQLAEKT
ncbi:MAG: hypothetical protein LBC85_01030 [Fibromonadaceae bacterium]|nr:hypothetical protein [Fibromonadaceae bacterium]